MVALGHNYEVGSVLKVLTQIILFLPPTFLGGVVILPYWTYLFRIKGSQVTVIVKEVHHALSLNDRKMMSQIAGRTLKIPGQAVVTVTLMMDQRQMVRFNSKTWYYRAFMKISSCWVNTTCRQGQTAWEFIWFYFPAIFPWK